MSGWRQLVLGVTLGALAAPVFAQSGATLIEKSPALANGSIAIAVDEPDLVGPPAPSNVPEMSQLSAIEAKRAPASEPTAANSETHSPSPLEGKPLGKAAEPTGRKFATDDAEKATVGSGGLNGQISEFAKVGGALAAVLTLAFAARAIFRRAGGMNGGGARPSGVVEILARYPVPGVPGARGQQILVIKFARRIVLAHANGSSMTALCEMTDADEVAGVLSRLEAGSNARTAGKFKQTLAQFQTEHRTVKVRESERLIPSQGDAGEVVDLTRGTGRGLFGLLGRNSGGAAK